MPSTSPHGQTRECLDLVRAMEEIGSVETLHTMLPMLHEMLERDIRRIDRLLSRGEVSAVYPLLHSMKGCLPLFCVPALCEHLAQVEQLSKAGGSAEVGQAFARLRPRLQRLQMEVAQHLAQSSDQGSLTTGADSQ